MVSFSGCLSLKVTVGNSQDGSRAQGKPAIIRVSNYEMLLSGGSIEVLRNADGQVVITSNSPAGNDPGPVAQHPEVQPPSPRSDSDGSQVSLAEIIDTGAIRPLAYYAYPTTPPGPPIRPQRSPRRTRRVAVRAHLRRETSSEPSSPSPFPRATAPPPYSPGGYWTSTTEEVSIMEEILDENGILMI
ncbi:hypothetical protein CKAH01_15691 [Colletotrichum kahawae]|uniref:Uncharacterized protein n=1 Tax=Colletotrichum kahawae TaxID=34407 RepID=A0AAD9YI87_COLKA|nr:hypothetical protein CKAH01_15691 [Colletotrichum kahawae]